MGATEEKIRKAGSFLFDLDGTLTEPFEGITNAIKYALKACGAPIPPLDTLKKFIGPPLSYSFKTFLCMTDAEADEALKNYRIYYSDKGIFELKLYDGVTQMLDGLRAAGKKVYIATSKPEPFALRIAEKFGLNVDGVAGASFDASRAEKDQVLAYAIDRFCIDPARAVMVGDRKYDVEGAKKFGLSSVGVLYGYGTREELAAAGADVLCTSPADVIKKLLAA